MKINKSVVYVKTLEKSGVFFWFIIALLYCVVFHTRLFPMNRLAKSLLCNQEARRWKI